MADIAIHTHGNIAVELFQPLNNMSIVLVANGDHVNLFGIDAARAWALFDMFRDSDTGFYYGEESMHRIGDDPVRAAELVARARAATLEVEVAA
ncbi:hypothetical protein [Hyphomonas sp. CY54-11-8]|uniref:hypothetical protein n=1 Tax=Hyphomonas sp. CY54-11-8 TaxID=1280944 RepID=UPI000458B639|nr:hypothetical protein [Hyphomonas sp. CY54-11-8]KCZ47744.1 hypothetical protein HY17_04510 [Hyphomonas sp. CY54-11-8]